MCSNEESRVSSQMETREFLFLYNESVIPIVFEYLTERNGVLFVTESTDLNAVYFLFFLYRFSDLCCVLSHMTEQPLAGAFLLLYLKQISVVSKIRVSKTFWSTSNGATFLELHSIVIALWSLSLLELAQERFSSGTKQAILLSLPMP